jgi:tetratricopeptide (TPR) repeat protein
MSDPFDFQTPPDLKIKVGEVGEADKDSSSASSASSEASRLSELQAPVNDPEKTVSTASVKQTASPSQKFNDASRSGGAPPLTLKPKRYFSLKYLPLLIFLAPMLAAIVCLAIDPPARLIFDARNAETDEAITKLTAAIKIRPDLETYKNLSFAYLGTDKWEERTAALSAMVKMGVCEGEIYNDLAFAKSQADGASAEVIALLNKSVDLSIANCRAFPLSGETSSLRTAGYDLLSCGRPEGAIKIAAMPPHLFLEDTEKKVLKALALRESGKDAESMALFKTVALGSGAGHSVPPEIAYHGALMALDHSNLSLAKQCLNQGNHVLRRHENPWLMHLVTAWISYDEGKYAKAVNEANKTISGLNGDTDQVRELQAIAAMQILKAKAQEKLAKTIKAHEAMSDYVENKMTGRFFIPKEHRDWLRTD